MIAIHLSLCRNPTKGVHGRTETWQRGRKLEASVFGMAPSGEEYDRLLAHTVQSLQLAAAVTPARGISGAPCTLVSDFTESTHVPPAKFPSDEDDFECAICDATYSHRWKLDSHQRCHNNDGSMMT